MNLAVVPHATSVAACALLGERRRGLFRADLALRMQQLVDLLRMMSVRLTPRCSTTRATSPTRSRRSCAWT
jgi:hypothetical protein